MANSFQVAHLHKLTSIAIPAIGTGTLGFPPETVADVMLDELMKFSRDNPRTTLIDVRFVVYQNNIPTIQASVYTHHTGKCIYPPYRQVYIPTIQASVMKHFTRAVSM